MSKLIETVKRILSGNSYKYRDKLLSKTRKDWGTLVQVSQTQDRYSKKSGGIHRILVGCSALLMNNKVYCEYENELYDKLTARYPNDGFLFYGDKTRFQRDCMAYNTERGKIRTIW